MPDLMSYEDWKQKTYQTFSRRSSALKESDEALKLYHEHKKWRTTSEFLSDAFKEDLRQIDLRKVDEAFGAWRTEKGLNYLDSSRNEDGAVLELEKQLRLTLRKTSTELAAHRELARMREK